jgi:peptidoglycan-associated lipoprotein
MTINSIRIVSLITAALLSACASLEEQTPAAPTPQASVPAPAPAPTARPAPRQAVPSALAAPVATAPGKIAAPGKRSVYFDFDTSDIKPEFRTVIEENAKYLRTNPSLRVKIEGNCDERGSREYNVALGQRRAEAVMKMMVVLGVPEGRMEAISYGEEKPRQPGHDEASWAENRRGDVVLDIK